MNTAPGTLIARQRKLAYPQVVGKKIVCQIDEQEACIEHWLFS